MNDFCASIRCLAAMSGKRKSSCGFQHFPTFQLLVLRTTAVLKSRSSLQVGMTKTALATLKLVYVRIHGAMQFTHIERQALVDPSPGWEALILYGEILCRKNRTHGLPWPRPLQPCDWAHGGCGAQTSLLQRFSSRM